MFEYPYETEALCMEKQEHLNLITELTAQISELPKGYLSKKTISGKTYYYHQWSEKA